MHHIFFSQIFAKKKEKVGPDQAYMRKASSVAGLAIWAKKNWRKIWRKNGLKWPKMAKNCLKLPKIA